MENILGLLRIHIHRGVNLAIRDMKSSDPYVVVRLGKQKFSDELTTNPSVKLPDSKYFTETENSCSEEKCEPVWDEDLTLSIADPNTPIKLMVFDKDTFSFDDKMGDAEFDIKPLIEAVKMRLEGSLVEP
ncbi:hypothetical protein C3L33_06337, partial [Rhododendron williamsianum]